jgi:hypothetical protein
LLGALTVGSAAVILGATAVEQIVSGIVGMTSTDGLTRILSPVIILKGLFAGALAIAGLAGSWRTARSRGRRQGGALVAGLLVALGAASMYADGPAPDRMLPAYAFSLVVLGTGVATSGWVLGWINRHLPSSAAALRRLGAASAAALAAMPLVIGVLMAQSVARDAELAIPEGERARLISEAHTVWDNPFHRLAYLELAVTIQRESVLCGTDYTVEAFTLFGLRPDYLQLNECGASLRESPRAT